MPTAPKAAVTLPRSQHGGAQILLGLVVETDQAEHRRVAVAIAMRAKERQLLRAMGGIVGRVQIDCDATNTAAQPFRMALDDAQRQHLAQAVIDLAGLPRVMQTSGQAVNQFIAPIGRLQQQSATVGTALALVETSHNRLGLPVHIPKGMADDLWLWRQEWEHQKPEDFILSNRLKKDGFVDPQNYRKNTQAVIFAAPFTH
jgi:hypothetical protein